MTTVPESVSHGVEGRDGDEVESGPESSCISQCLICLQTPQIPARLSCSCRFDCCLPCLLEWVRGARHNKEHFEQLEGGGGGGEQSTPEGSALPAYFSHSNGVCPMCRRPDVILVVDNALLLGGEVRGGGGTIAFTADAVCTEEDIANPTDISNRLMREGYALIAKWETMGRGRVFGEKPHPPSPPPPADVEEDAGAKVSAEIFENKMVLYKERLAEYEQEEREFKLPLKQAVHYFINSVVANPANAQGYIGLAYLNLLVSDHALAERYLRFILDNINPSDDDALKLLAYIEQQQSE